MGELNEKTKRNLWIAIGVAAVIYFGAIVFLKVSNSAFPMGQWLTYLVLGLLVGGAASAGVLFLSKKQSAPSTDGRLPPAITYAQAKALAKSALADPDYADEIDLERVEVDTPVEVGSPPSLVYKLVCWGKYAGKNRYAIGINMHYPETRRGMMVGASDHEINTMIRRLAAFPEKEPDVRRTTTRNEALGLETQTEEITRPKEPEKDKKVDELDK